jgi:hypothetical protein
MVDAMPTGQLFVMILTPGMSLAGNQTAKLRAS